MSVHLRVSVDTSRRSGLLYEITEVSGTFYVDDYGESWLLAKVR